MLTKKIACKPLKIVSVVVFIAALFNFLGGFWVHAKAELAQYLIGESWQQARMTETSSVKPWPWADTWPVARLQYWQSAVQVSNIERQSVQDLYILEGAQGNSLAFGPGHLSGSALPGEIGVSIIGGHRDTHFKFLKDVQLGERFTVTPREGPVQHYQVTDTRIANSLTEPLLVLSYESQLILVTCYPFDAIVSGGPLRYVVTAVINNSEFVL